MTGVDVDVAGVSKRYTSPGGTVHAVEDVTLRVHAGEAVAVIGPSGCGKSTLLGLIAGLDIPSSGTISLDGREISSMDDEERAQVRRRHVGLVFQSDNLLPFLTAAENVAVQRVLRGRDGEDSASDRLLADAGLADEIGRLPDELSGGQRQRVALARALVHEPRLIVADEPTGSLDPDTAGTIVEMLLEARRASGATLVVVTHEPSVAERMQRTVSLRDGRVVGDTASDEHGSPS
jgi:putative ABC transport system ATP-binding protein